MAEKEGLLGERRWVRRRRTLVWDVARRGEVNLAKGLFNQPPFRSIFGDLSRIGELIDSGDSFPISLWVEVDLCQFGIHRIY